MSLLSYGSDRDAIKVEVDQHDAALSPTPGRSPGSKWKKMVLATAGTALCVGSAVAAFQGWSSYLTQARIAAERAAAPNGMFLESQIAFDVKSDFSLLNSGQEVMLRVRGKNNLCIDDGGGWAAGTSKFTNKPCNPSSPNQIFKYNAATKEFASVYKTGLCIDDGGSWFAAGTKAHLWYCDPNNQNQWFVMDPNTLMLKNPVKNNLCFDDGGGTTAGSSKYVMWYCDNNNGNQHFEVLSRAAVAAEKKAKVGTTMYDLMVSGEEIMFKVRGKNNLCVDDGGSFNAATTKFVDMPCNPNSVNQVFKYNIKTGEFENVNKPGLCIDDGGSWNAAGTKAHLWYCDINNQNQWFDVDETTMMFKNPVKDNLCLDDGGGTTAGATKFVMWYCDNNNGNQHFDVVSRASLLEEKKKTGPTPYDMLLSGEEIMFRVRGKNDLCVDDGGGWGAAVTKFTDKPCNPSSPSQVFKYNVRTLEFENVNKPGLCIDDGGSWFAAGSTAHLWWCDANNQNQWYVLDESQLMLRNPMKEGLCFDDGGGTTAGATKFVMWKCDINNPNQHFEILSRAAMLEEKKKKLGLTPYDILTSGQELMLRVRGKNNLCVDDGGGWTAAATKFSDQPCNPDSPNQVFKYDVKTREFENVNKPGFCIDDGGSWFAGLSTAHLWYCDANNQNQWFVLDEETLMLHNPMKAGLCFDDGGATSAGATKFVMWWCDNNNANQHFEILPRADVIEARRKKRVAAGIDDDLDLLNSGQKLMLRVRGKNNLCVDDGGGRSNGATKFNDQPCDPTSPNQIFTYDAKTKQFQSANKPGLCMDDGGAWNAAGSQAHLWDCDPNNQNQWFVLDEDTMMLRNPAKPNLCFDDGGGTTAGATKFVMWYCDNNNPNQHYEILSQAKMIDERKQRLIAAGLDDEIDLLASGQQVMLRVRGKNNLCVDDGGGRSNGATKFVDKTCNPSSPNQIFTYDANTRLFKSVNKPGLCMDDGGGWSAAQTTAHLWQCDPNNQNQWFVWDENTMMLRNPAKPNLCFDDGGGTTPGATKYWLWGCDNNNPNQHFEVLSAAAMAAEKKKARIAAGNTAVDILATGQEIMLRVRGKNNLCVDDGGGRSNGQTKFVDQPCNPDSPNQIFKYDSMTHQFKSVNKPGLCMDDGGSWNAAGSQAHLWDCDPNNQNQWFVMDEDTLMLRNPVKDNLCFDDGGGTTAGATKYVMWTCDESNPNQHFEVLPRAIMLAEKRKRLIAAGVDDDVDLLSSGQPLMLRVRGKDNLCADDGGGHSNGETKFEDQPCDPTSPNQIFTYDTVTHQFKSVNKPGLCMDDGGGWSAGQTTAHLWDCDPNNQNQWFILDQDNMMLQNPVKPNLCFDDGGGTAPGASKYLLWNCDAANQNQHFEIIAPASLPVPAKNPDIELLNSGKPVMLRVRGKDNLCADDGGGRSNGETKFVDMPCDPNSPNQIFTYEAKTRLFKSVNKPGLCMDDGGGWSAAQTTAHLWQCDPNNQNQWFTLDKNNMLRNPAKPNLCFDDGGGMTPGASKYWLWTCDNANQNQHFEVVSPSSLPALKVDSNDLLSSGQPLMIRVRGKDNLCADDGGGRSNGETKFVDMPCDPTSPNQIFTYDAKTRLFKSVNKPGLCMDDGGGWSAAQTTAHLWQCDPNNQNQWFTLDKNNMLRNPAKPNLCFDDGGGMTPGASKYWLWNCDNANQNQHFEIISPASLPAPVKKDSDLLSSGQPLMLRVRGKDNLCADDGGGRSNGATKFIDMPCDPNSPNQIFTYDAKTLLFQSVNKPGLCMDDGGGWSAAQTTAHLWQCDPNNQNQWFTLDKNNMLRNPAKPNLCFDDGGGTTPGASKYWLWDCDNSNPNQHFEVISPTSLQGTAPVPAPPTPGADYMQMIESGIKVLIRANRKNNLCLDDGGGRSNAETKFVYQPCDPNSPNQIFSYDVNSREFRSVNKPGLCLDDGGGWNAGDSTAHLWQCDPGNMNQWFVTDADTMLFHNPAKPGLCFDDMGSMNPGQSNFVMWYCAADSPNQQFEVVPQWELLGTVPDVGPPPLPVIDDGPWTTIDNGDDILPPPPIEDVLPPVVVDDNGFVVDPLVPTTGGDDLPPSDITQPLGPDTTYNPPGPDDNGVVVEPVWHGTGGDQLPPPDLLQPLGPDTTYNPPGPDNNGPVMEPWTPGGNPDITQPIGKDTTYNQLGPDNNGPVQEPLLRGTGSNGGFVEPPSPPDMTGPGPIYNPPVPGVDGSGLVQPTGNTGGWEDTLAQVIDTTDTTGQDIATNPDVLPANPDQVGPVGPAVLPFQEDNNLPIPNVPIIKKADLPLADYGDRDWNLLAPSNDTLSIINKDDSPIISAAKIFKYLQTLKDRADVQHQVTMDRYKRTFQCATDGLKTLAKDAVTNDEYHVLVQWMYDHCAAGATDVKPVVDPSGPVSDEVLKRDDIAQFNDDDKINRQFMTKLDFYYEIKNHYADKNAELVGNAAVANLRSSETLKLEKKLVDCIEEAAERFGYKQDQTSNEDPQDRLKQAIAWVQDTCMAS